jgi:DNA-binding LytR/AlgR family response regulator
MSTLKQTAILVEDEAPQRDELIAMLGVAWPDLEIVAVCSDGLQAMDALSEHKPDLAFLDIRIPGINGIEVGKYASELGIHVVFTTAYDHYAVEAFNQRAVDYVLKPVNAERLAEAVKRLQERLHHCKQRYGQSPGQLSAQTDATLRALSDMQERKSEPLRWIMASAGDAIKMVAVEDVLFFQSQDKYTRVVTDSIDTHIRTPLKELLQGLDENKFWVIHRSVIVRVDAIDKVTRDDAGRLSVRVKGKNESLLVSLAYQSRFKSM